MVLYDTVQKFITVAAVCFCWYYFNIYHTVVLWSTAHVLYSASTAQRRRVRRRVDTWQHASSASITRLASERFDHEPATDVKML